MASFAQDLDFSGRRILVTGAANGLGAAIAETFARQNGSLVLVRAVCLAPGRSLIRMTRETARPDYAGDRGLARVPLGRWGTPEEIAKLVVFLASDAAAYVTGETLIADGGYVIG
jgi:NAD(P)-dependent dehydrogenase (short-subunit alcohol dehydrogenase family)